MGKNDSQKHFIAKKRYVTERELSQIISKSRPGLQLDRYHGRGLPYIKLGGKILYDMTKVDAYLEAHTITPED